MAAEDKGRSPKGNVYRFDPSRKNKRREKNRSGVQRAARGPGHGRNLPVSKRGIHPLLVFLAAVVLFVLVSRWFGQLSVP